jgi:hypothetical protein
MEEYPANTLILTSPFQEQFHCTFLCNNDFDKRAVCYIVPILQVPTMPLAIGKEMLWYDEESNYYWRYVISEIITIIGLNIICKFSLLFDQNYPLKYYSNIELLDDQSSIPSMPLWSIDNNSLIDPIADNGYYEVGGINFNYTYCIIKRMDFRSTRDSSILYLIRPLTDDEEVNLDINKIVPIIHIVMPEDNSSLESFDIWKEQFRNRKVRIIENNPEVVSKKTSHNIVISKYDENNDTLLCIPIEEEVPCENISCDQSEKAQYDDTLPVYTEQSSTDEETSSETTIESTDSIIEELTTEILEEILKKVVGNLSSTNSLRTVKESSCNETLSKPVVDSIVKKVRNRNRNKKNISFRISKKNLQMKPNMDLPKVIPSTKEHINKKSKEEPKKDDFYEGYIMYTDLSVNIDNIQRLPGGLVPNAEPLDLLQADGACERLPIKNDKEYTLLEDPSSIGITPVQSPSEIVSIYEPVVKNIQPKNNKYNKNKKTKKTVVKSNDLDKSKKEDIILHIISSFETLFSKIIEVNKLDKNEIYDKYITYALSIVNNDNEIKDKDIYLNLTKTYIVTHFAQISNNFTLESGSCERLQEIPGGIVPVVSSIILDKPATSQCSEKKIFRITKEEKPKHASSQTIPDCELLKYIPIFNEKFGDFTKSLDKALKKELLIKFVTMPIQQFIEVLPSYIRENNKNIEYSKEKINNFKVIFKLEFIFDKLRAKFMGDLKGDELIQRYLIFEPCCMKLLMQYYYPFLMDNTSTGKTYDHVFLSMLKIMELHLAMLYPFFSPDLVNWDILQNPDIDSTTKIMVRSRIKVSELLETVHENLEVPITRDLSLYVANLFYDDKDGAINQYIIRLGNDDELFIEKCITSYFNNLMINDFSKKYNILAIIELEKQTMIL